MKMIEMMRRVFLSLFLVQAAISAAHAQGLAPIAITGFNSDIVANRTGSAASTTSVAADLFDTVLGFSRLESKRFINRFGPWLAG